MRIIHIYADNSLCDECFTNDNPDGSMSRPVVVLSSDGGSITLCQKHWHEAIASGNETLKNLGVLAGVD